MEPSGYQDSFARDNLPPLETWPEMLFELPALRYPARLNCASQLLDPVIRNGDGARIAVLSPTRALTYDELYEFANRIARILRDDLRLSTGSRVLLRGYNDPTLLASWLGVLKAGCIAVTTMPLLRSKELIETIERAQVTTALCDSRLRDDLDLARLQSSTLKTVVWWNDGEADGLEARAAKHPGDFKDVETAADDVCAIAFTSGTTGMPKGTMHFHRDMLAVCDTFPPATFRATREDVFVGTPPLAFTFGLGALLLFPLRAGAAVLLLETAAPDAILGAIEQQRATICFSSPTGYRAMTPTASRYDLRSLRACVSAGEPLPVRIREDWKAATGIEIIDGIGTTEMLHVFISEAPDAVRPGATGRPIPGFRCAILDERGVEAADGVVGRLAVRGPTGCRYLNDARQSTYVSNGWNITGDAYLRDSDGYYWFKARTDDMIVSSGYNIAGPEVEAALLLHPDVVDCAVVGAPDEERGFIVKAFIVLRDDAPRDDSAKRDLQDFAKLQIAPYKYPRAIEFVATLPRTQSGKVQRYVLRAEPTGAS